MPTVKIRDLLKICTDVDHSPDVKDLEPGVYRHTCDACGHIEEFSIFMKGFKVTITPNTGGTTTIPYIPYVPYIPNPMPAPTYPSIPQWPSQPYRTVPHYTTTPAPTTTCRTV